MEPTESVCCTYEVVRRALTRQWRCLRHILPAVLMVLVVQAGCTSEPYSPSGAGWAYFDGAPLLVSPPVRSDTDCGLDRDDYKIGGRIDPPVGIGDHLWRFTGCLYYHGAELRNVIIVLTFEADQRAVVKPVADSVPKDHREVPFSFQLSRANTLGFAAYVAFSYRI